MNRYLIIFLTLFLVFAQSSAVLAGESAGCDADKTFCGGMMAKPGSEYFDAKRESLDVDLGLNEKQKAQLKQMRLDKQNELSPLNKQIAALQQEIKTVKSSSLTAEEKRAKVSQLEKDIATAQKKVLSVKQRKQKEFEAILTEDQLKKYKQITRELQIETDARQFHGQKIDKITPRGMKNAS